MKNIRKIKAIDKALKILLKKEEEKIKSQGYKSVDEFISELKKVPISDLKNKQKEIKENKKKE